MKTLIVALLLAITTFGQAAPNPLTGPLTNEEKAAVLAARSAAARKVAEANKAIAESQKLDKELLTKHNSDTCQIDQYTEIVNCVKSTEPKGKVK